MKLVFLDFGDTNDDWDEVSSAGGIKADVASVRSVEKMEEISSQTERMRLTGEIGRFFNEILPYIREANITLIAINQIKTNPGMGIVKSPAEILYLKQDEALNSL